MITSRDCVPRCNCRTIDECFHGINAEVDALEKCTKQFREAMFQKLKDKYNFDRKLGWDDKRSLELLERSLKDHIDKGDMVDVANLAMFIWNIKQP